MGRRRVRKKVKIYFGKWRDWVDDGGKGWVGCNVNESNVIESKRVGISREMCESESNFWNDVGGERLSLALNGWCVRVFPAYTHMWLQFLKPDDVELIELFCYCETDANAKWMRICCLFFTINYNLMWFVWPMMMMMESNCVLASAKMNAKSDLLMKATQKNRSRKKIWPGNDLPFSVEN